MVCVCWSEGDPGGRYSLVFAYSNSEVVYSTLFASDLIRWKPTAVRGEWLNQDFEILN